MGVCVFVCIWREKTYFLYIYIYIYIYIRYKLWERERERERDRDVGRQTYLWNYIYSDSCKICAIFVVGVTYWY